MITVPRALLVVIAAVFSAYHVFLGFASLGRAAASGPVVVSLVLYAIATVATLWPTDDERLAAWVAAFDLAVAIALPLLVTSQLPQGTDNGYATWYVAAIGTLMTVVAVRRRVIVSWIALAFLGVQTFRLGRASRGGRARRPRRRGLGGPLRR